MRARRVPINHDAAALGGLIADLQDRIADLEQADQASERSIDDGALEIYDDDDVLRARIGKQPDGSFTAKTFGKKPATPTEPDVIPVAGGCVVEWDGSFDEAQPEDVQRIAVHVGLTPNFQVVTSDDEDSDEDSTERTAIVSPRGGQAFLSLDPGEDKWYVRLTAVAEGGVESDPSDAVEVLTAAPEAAYFQDEFLLSVPGPQDLKLTYEPLDMSEHLYWNGLYQREDVAWDRIRKTVSLTGQPFPPEVGDTVVVEYAYLLGEQPEEITYYRGTPKGAWYHGQPSLSTTWTDTYYLQFEEPIGTIHAAPLWYAGGGDLTGYSLRVDWYARKTNGELYMVMGSYTNKGIPYSGWGAGFGNGNTSPGTTGNDDQTIYRQWTLYHTLAEGEQHPHNLVGVQVYPYGGADADEGRVALGITPGGAIPPGTMLPQRGFFWLGEQLDGKPKRWGPLGNPVPVP